jgi:hypothetical protein
MSFIAGGTIFILSSLKESSALVRYQSGVKNFLLYIMIFILYIIFWTNSIDY